MSIALGQTREDPVVSSFQDHPVGSPTPIRREFLNALAYLCDYEQYGWSVTAIALEERIGSIVYHSGSNDIECSVELNKFLTQILAMLENPKGRKEARLEMEILTVVFEQFFLQN